MDVQNIEGYEELMVMLEERGWMRLDILIKETNKSIELELFTNVAFHTHNDFIYYVRIDYHLSVINYLLHLQPKKYVQYPKQKGYQYDRDMCETMRNEFCQPGDEWVIVRGKPLKLLTRQMHHIPKAWGSFIMQTLESTSN